MPIDFEKLLKTNGFSNKSIAPDTGEKKSAFITKDFIEEKKAEIAPVKPKKKRKANPQPNLKIPTEDEGKLSVRSIIDSKPAKKVIIEYIKNKIEMFADSDSD
jgi:hypothetical protein